MHRLFLLRAYGDFVILLQALLESPQKNKYSLIASKHLEPLYQELTLVIDLSGSDPDNDSLTYAVESLPSYGTIFQNDSNTQTYVPNTGFVGQDELTYKAFDGTYYSDPATIIINVTGE